MTKLNWSSTPDSVRKDAKLYYGDLNGGTYLLVQVVSVDLFDVTGREYDPKRGDDISLFTSTILVWGWMLCDSDGVPQEMRNGFKSSDVAQAHGTAFVYENYRQLVPVPR